MQMKQKYMFHISGSIDGKLSKVNFLSNEAGKKILKTQIFVIWKSLSRQLKFHEPKKRKVTESMFPEFYFLWFAVKNW